jgi:hypothetical protein
MRIDWMVRALVVAGAVAVLAGTAAAQANGEGDPPRPIVMPPNPYDTSIAQLLTHCGDPIHCPPIRAGFYGPLEEIAQVSLPPDQALSSPSARVLGVFAGAQLASPAQVQARRDAKDGWVLANADGSFLLAGERLGYVGSTYFGDVVVLAQTSEGVPLADKEIDGRAAAIVMALPHGDGLGRTGALGVWFDGQRWWAYNEDGTKVPAGQHVVYLDAADKGGRAKHEAQNDFGGIGLVLDDARLNGRPDAVLVAQHVFGTSRNRSPLAVAYDSGAARWIVYNADGSPLAMDEAIHYIVGP